MGSSDGRGGDDGGMTKIEDGQNVGIFMADGLLVSWKSCRAEFGVVWTIRGGMVVDGGRHLEEVGLVGGRVKVAQVATLRSQGDSGGGRSSQTTGEACSRDVLDGRNAWRWIAGVLDGVETTDLPFSEARRSDRQKYRPVPRRYR